MFYLQVEQDKLLDERDGQNWKKQIRFWDKFICEMKTLAGLKENILLGRCSKRRQIPASETRLEIEHWAVDDQNQALNLIYSCCHRDLVLTWNCWPAFLFLKKKVAEEFLSIILGELCQMFMNIQFRKNSTCGWGWRWLHYSVGDGRSQELLLIRPVFKFHFSIVGFSLIHFWF